MTYKRLNDIYSLKATTTNEVYIAGTDEEGNDFTVILNSFNFLQWLDSDSIEYIKEKTIKHINNL